MAVECSSMSLEGLIFSPADYSRLNFVEHNGVVLVEFVPHGVLFFFSFEACTLFFLSK